MEPLRPRIEDLDVQHADCDLTAEKNTLRALNCGSGTRIEIKGLDANRELDASIRSWKNA